MNNFAKMLAMWNPYNWSAAVDDKTLFNSWEREELATKQVLARFLKNNKIVLKKPVDLDEFEKWLNGLGYHRSLTRGSIENPYK